MLWLEVTVSVSVKLKLSLQERMNEVNIAFSLKVVATRSYLVNSVIHLLNFFFIQVLKTIEALDAWEDVTELGNHLLDLPVEPRLGKMLLYSIALKCVDPVLTIVACAAYK